MSQQNLPLSLLQGKELDYTPEYTCKNRLECCNSIFCWLFTFGTWTFIILIAYSLKTIFIIFGIITYIIYLIFELCSGKFNFISLISKDDIYEIVKNNVKANPNINFYCQCYHKDSVGERGSRTVVTHEETLPFFFHSCRDISGLLVLNTTQKNIKNKYFLKLNFIQKIYFADELTKNNYNYQKRDFIERNRIRDTNFTFKLLVNFKNIKPYNIILLTEKAPWFINKYFYIIFSFLALVEFYKIFINLITFEQTLQIKKCISNTNNLSVDRKYNQFNPELFITHINKYYRFESISDNYRNNEIFGQQNNIPPNYIPSNEINNNNSNINNDNNNINNSNLFGNNQRPDNQINMNSIHAQSEQDLNSTKYGSNSSKSEINN